MPSRIKPIHAEEVSAATAFGAPRNKFGDGGGHLGSAAAAWLGGVFVCYIRSMITNQDQWRSEGPAGKSSLRH